MGGKGRSFGLEWKQLAVDRRRMHNEKLCDLHNSPSVVWSINSRGVGWAWHVASMEARSGATGIWWGTGSYRDHMGGLGIGRRIILRWTFRK